LFKKGIDALKKNVKWAPLFTIYWYLANYLFVCISLRYSIPFINSVKVWGIAYTNVPSSLTIEQVWLLFFGPFSLFSYFVKLATVFVFILSVIFLKEVATIGKILAVLVCKTMLYCFIL
jgi:hypothetical protein